MVEIFAVMGKVLVAQTAEHWASDPVVAESNPTQDREVYHFLFVFNVN